MMDLVPRKKHEELLKKYESLQKKLEEQNERINNLQKLFRAQGNDHESPEKTLPGLLAKQGEQFQQFMNDFFSFFEGKDTKKEK